MAHAPYLDLRGLLLKGGRGRGGVEERRWDREGRGGRGREGRGRGREREGPPGTCLHPLI